MWRDPSSFCCIKAAFLARLTHPRPRSPLSIVTKSRLATSSLRNAHLQESHVPQYGILYHGTVDNCRLLLACMQPAFHRPIANHRRRSASGIIAKFEMPYRFAAVRNMVFRRPDDVKATGFSLARPQLTHRAKCLSARGTRRPVLPAPRYVSSPTLWGSVIPSSRGEKGRCPRFFLSLSHSPFPT